jgi:site-specific DNA-cytosine methylase
MTKFQEWPDADVDVLVGGTPCQSFSVAGLRKGLSDPRGNLALTYLALADRYRPEWLVWENVPGVLSSGDGRDFGAFLGGLAELGYGWAYRSLDAQHFGLAQRRKRVFVVASARGWQRAAAVLFERASMSGHPAPRREAGQDITYSTAPSLTDSGRGTARAGEARGQDCLIPDVCPTLRAGGNRTGGDRPPGTDVDTCDSLIVAHSLRAEGFDASEDGTGRGTPLVPVAYGLDEEQNARQSDVLQYGDQCGPLDTDGHSIGVAYALRANGGAPRPELGLDTLVTAESCYNQGIIHASPQETHASTLLRTLQEEVGTEAFTQWGLGILDSLLPAEVLRSALHGGSVRLTANFSRRWLVYHALARQEAHSEGLVLAMREAEREGRASQGWRPSEQLARELGAYLSELSQPGPQAARFMRDLWQASEGAGLLREALSAVQEMGRPSRRESEPAHKGMSVRRLTTEECEFLQGFPRGYTAIHYRGKPAADGPRYKALGNSMAVPVMRWIGERIAQVNAIECNDVSGNAVISRVAV